MQPEKKVSYHESQPSTNKIKYQNPMRCKNGGQIHHFLNGRPMTKSKLLKDGKQTTSKVSYPMRRKNGGQVHQFLNGRP